MDFIHNFIRKSVWKLDLFQSVGESEERQLIIQDRH
jgi:hypothetical protein